MKITTSLLTFTLLSNTIIFAACTHSPRDLKLEYSPYPEKTFPNKVYFGDTHLHTSYSTDAGMTGNSVGPEDALRVSRGEVITSSTGLKVKLSRPLDFVVITDHAENLGLSPAIAGSNPELLKNEWGKTVHDWIKNDGYEGQVKAYEAWLRKVGVLDDPLKGSSLPQTFWQRSTALVEKYNEPGRFTALIGFEWTSMPQGNNLHRNVIFRGGKDKADKIIPISAYDATDPEKLWEWMEAYEKKTGGQLLAIPHNGNLSNGLMFDDVTYTSKKPLDQSYAQRRMRWEPLYEVTQMKGDGEAHPSLSPNDDFADFDTWDSGSFGPQAKTPDMLPKEYAREALKRGLAYEEKLGTNPFKFGMIGATDSHTSIPSTEEDNYFGKVSLLEPSANPIRFNEVIAGRPLAKEKQIQAWRISSSGLAGVWARENTREAIWDAMKRKEVYATTGTRLKVRTFMGWDFTKEDLDRSDFAENGYAKGVPMGGDISKAPQGKAPTMLIRAVRDADGANIDRVQVIKGWLDKDDKTHEKVYDVAVSDDRKPNADGKYPPVGNTVNAKEATYTNAIGDPFMQVHWSDPEFDASQKAFYYVRVIEIPTPRWTTYDAKVFGVEIPKGAPVSIQERAYTSPIWYTPKGAK